MRSVCFPQFGCIVGRRKAALPGITGINRELLGCGSLAPSTSCTDAVRTAAGTCGQESQLQDSGRDDGAA